MNGRSCSLFIIAAASLLVGCQGAAIRTMPMHEPIYPGSGDAVTYTLETSSDQGIANVKLYELVSTVNSSGNVDPGTESLLKEWDVSGEPQSTTVTHVKSGGYSANRLVRYRFHVTNGCSRTKSHSVTFAVRPYPVTDHPAPVYAQGDINNHLDIIFIPDSDITNMATFRGHCRGMIVDAVFAENCIGPRSQWFNFYINPDTGTATDYNNISTAGYHQKPANWANLTFAEAQVLMHQNSLRDYAWGGLFSTEQQNRGTMMHEGGHGLFDLADEYPGGAHWQDPIFPNNWETLAGAQADAPSRHKTAADAREMGTSGWYRICVDGCQMEVSGLNRSDYDDPCDDRVKHVIGEVSSNP